MKTLELSKNFYYVGVVDHSLKVFDVAVRTDSGTSYNSYLLKTDDGAIVFEGNKEKYVDEYLDNLRAITPLEKIKYIFVTHTEPDHSGAIETLLKLDPSITVIASPGALMNLDKITRLPFKRIPMTPGKDLAIGGYHFQFISGLMLHWPDVMFTYIKELRTLISCDAFGAHYAYDDIVLSKMIDRKPYYVALKYYYDHIMGPFASFVLAACDKVDKLDIRMICPGHGPVIDTAIKEQISIYRKFATEGLPQNNVKHVTIVYCSAYGYTKEMAQYLKDRYEKDGNKVSIYEIDALNYAGSKDKIINDIRVSGTVLLGSPTIVGDAVSLFYDLLSSITWTLGQGKHASVFGDYGWSGEAVRNLSDRLTELHFSVIGGFRYNFKIDDQGYKELDEYYSRLIK